PGHLTEHWPARLPGELDADGLEPSNVASRVTEEALRRDRVDSFPAFLVSRGDPVDVRVLRPRVVRRALIGRARQDLQLMDGSRPLAVDGAEAVGARIAAAEDHHVLVARRDEVPVRNEVALAAPVLRWEVLHREVDPGELAPPNREIARVACAACQDEGVVLLAQLFRVQVEANVGAGYEPDTLCAHLREAPVEHALLHLELGNAVPE